MNGTTAPSDDDIRKWCSACDSETDAPDLIAASRTAESSYATWKRIHRTGMKHSQQQYLDLYDRTKVFKVYCSNVLLGVLQLFEYATALMTTIIEFEGVPNDAEAAAQARIERSKVLKEGNHRFFFLLEEAVLRNCYGDAEVMTAQLGYLLQIMGRANVVLGIIPAGSRRDLGMWTVETFMILDDVEVQVELLAAYVTVTAPSEIQSYDAAFAKFGDMAVYGPKATKLITGAIDALR